MGNELNWADFEFQSAHEVHAFLDLFSASGTTLGEVSFVTA